MSFDPVAVQKAADRFKAEVDALLRHNGNEGLQLRRHEDVGLEHCGRLAAWGLSTGLMLDLCVSQDDLFRLLRECFKGLGIPIERPKQSWHYDAAPRDYHTPTFQPGGKFVVLSTDDSVLLRPILTSLASTGLFEVVQITAVGLYPFRRLECLLEPELQPVGRTDKLSVDIVWPDPDRRTEGCAELEYPKLPTIYVASEHGAYGADHEIAVARVAQLHVPGKNGFGSLARMVLLELDENVEIVPPTTPAS